jgi:hypothetical protein
MLDGSPIKHVPISKLTTRGLTPGMIKDLNVECNLILIIYISYTFMDLLEISNTKFANEFLKKL